MDISPSREAVLKIEEINHSSSLAEDQSESDMVRERK